MELTYDAINEAWEGVSNVFITMCQPIITQGRPYYILENVLLHINYPRINSDWNCICIWNHDNCKRYIDAVHPNKEYEIGRLFCYGRSKVNQFELITEKIRRNSQACYVAVCMDPEQDLLQRDSQTCLGQIDIVVNNRVLNMKATFSMMNLFTYGLLDIYQLARVQERLCMAAGCEKGKLSLFVSAVVMSDINKVMFEEICRHD